MATVTRLDAYYKRYVPSSGWGDWNPVEEDPVYGWLEENKAVAVKLADASSASGVITDISRTIKTLSSNSGGVVINIALFVNDDPTTYGTLSGALSHAVQVQQLSFGESTGFQYQDAVFSGLSAKANAAIYFVAYPGAEYQSNLTFEKNSSGGVTETTAPCAVIATSPKNETRTATNSMSYSWRYVGDTAQASAEVQYWSGSSWYALGTVQGSSTTLSSSVRPPASSAAKWRVRATDQRGNVSAWSEATYTLQYVSTSFLAPYNSKTSGSINRFAANTFSVQMQANGTPYHDYSVDDPVFYWRKSGETEWNSIQMTRQSVGGEYRRAAVTIPANTFPRGTIQWYAVAGDGEGGGYGNTRTTPTYYLSTVAVPITATPIAPIDTVETANTPTVFTWRDSGTITIYPAAAQLQYSEDNLSWTDFGSVTGSASTYTAEAGALPSGQLFWRVRVQNVDDVWGSWSDPVTFVNFGAPSVSQVLADARPFTTITWTSSTQQAYRITIDGSVVYGTYWGANVHAFTLPLPLADGAHTAAVEVQNEYGQWSQPAQTDFTVTNVPGAAVSLSRSVDIDAELYWSGGAGTGDFAVYRDGVRIARTGQQAFTDSLCLGEHEYFVLELLPDGYYTKSNVVTAEIFVPVPQIALLSGGPWIPMEKCLEISRRYTRKREKALTHYRGLTLPVVEWGSFWDESVELSVFYEYGQQADRFAALCGNTVVIKEPDGRMMVGALSELPEDAKAFHRFFTFTGDSVEWGDLTDGTQS
jgi:hypothetical protein